jgi:hypothetical protein
MFRFTIRDVLWLTVLAAVLVTWWIDRQGHIAKLTEARHDVRTLIYRHATKPSPFD